MSSSLPFQDLDPQGPVDLGPNRRIIQLPPNGQYADDFEEAITINGINETFHALVVYDKNPQNKALDFVHKLLEELEDKKGLKLCLIERDVMGGVDILLAISRLIANRCVKVVLILTKDFCADWECDFAMKYALTLRPNISAVATKIVPIKIDPDAVVPSVLSPTQVLDYTKKDLQPWFWDRLGKTLQQPVRVYQRQRPPPLPAPPPPHHQRQARRGDNVTYERRDSGYRTNASQSGAASSMGSIELEIIAAGTETAQEGGSIASGGSTRSVINPQNPLLPSGQEVPKKKKSGWKIFRKSPKM